VARIQHKFFKQSKTGMGDVLKSLHNLLHVPWFQKLLQSAVRDEQGEGTLHHPVAGGVLPFVCYLQRRKNYRLLFNSLVHALLPVPNKIGGH
jgi:hypothetical protein